MARDSSTQHADWRAQAQQLGSALDGVENRLQALELAADADVNAKGLSDAARAFDAAVREVAQWTPR